MQKEVLIILPAYNEEASIGAFLKKLTSSPAMEFADVVVINDASRDSTGQIAKTAGVTVLNHPFNLGYGSALQTGYKYAVAGNYHYLIQLDSDGQHDVCNVEMLYQQLKAQADTPDLVIGSRFLAGSQSFSISPIKKLAIAFFRKFIQLTSGQKITDPTSGLQGMNRAVFSYYAKYGNFDTNYPDANMIVQMSLLNYRIREIPAVMHQREAGRSMHFGIIEPICYMFIMVFSTCTVYLRNHKKVERGIHH